MPSPPGPGANAGRGTGERWRCDGQRCGRSVGQHAGSKSAGGASCGDGGPRGTNKTGMPRRSNSVADRRGSERKRSRKRRARCRVPFHSMGKQPARRSGPAWSRVSWRKTRLRRRAACDRSSRRAQALTSLTLAASPRMIPRSGRGILRTKGPATLDVPRIFRTSEDIARDTPGPCRSRFCRSALHR